MAENQHNSPKPGVSPGISLKTVDGIPKPVGIDVSKAARVMAVLEYHEKLQAENDGKSPQTIRQLLTTHARMTEGLMLEYISAFGAHGKAVIQRYIQNQSERGRAQYEEELARARKSILG